MLVKVISRTKRLGTGFLGGESHLPSFSCFLPPPVAVAYGRLAATDATVGSSLAFAYDRQNCRNAIQVCAKIQAIQAAEEENSHTF